MTKKEFIKQATKYYGEKLANECANDYTDEEIREHGEEILKDVAEDYRDFYRNTQN